MGMSIDKTIEFFNGLECHTPQAKDARDVAVDIMRKYQKITEIYQWAKDRSYLVEADDIMCKLKEVIENGNDKTGC